jgi:hypothetical protein
MPGRCTGDVVGGDRAVGGDPGGLGGQRLPAARDKAAQTVQVMARLPVAPRTRARLVRRGTSGRLQCHRLRHHVTAQREVAAAQQLRTAPSGDSHQATRPARRARPQPAQPGCGYWSARSRPGPRQTRPGRRPRPRPSRPGRRAPPATRSGQPGKPGGGSGHGMNDGLRGTHGALAPGG